MDVKEQPTQLRVLDLFSGIGGLSLGLEAAGMKTVLFCERDSFCRAVLKKHWPEVPCHDDVTTFDGAKYEGSVDLVCGGYPCQPFSVAGKQLGHEDERHLWPEMLRIIQGCRPRWVVAENVAGHISLGFDEVATSLEAEGFTVWPFVIPACAVDAWHRRDRLWIIANANNAGNPAPRNNNYGNGATIEQRRKVESFGQSGGYGAAVANTEGISKRYVGQNKWKGSTKVDPLSNSGGVSGRDDKPKNWQPLADSASTRQQRSRKSFKPLRSTSGEQGKAVDAFSGCFGDKWAAEPDVGRVAHGIPNRVDRLKALGNAVVPQIPFLIGKAIIEYEKEKT